MITANHIHVDIACTELWAPFAKWKIGNLLSAALSVINSDFLQESEMAFVRSRSLLLEIVCSSIFFFYSLLHLWVIITLVFIPISRPEPVLVLGKLPIIQLPWPAVKFCTLGSLVNSTAFPSDPAPRRLPLRQFSWLYLKSFRHTAESRVPANIRNSETAVY